MKANNLFKKIFYLPNYLSLQVAGIEICNKSIKYIEFFNNKGNLSVKSFGEVTLPANVVKDGDILNRDALVKALIEVKRSLTSDFVKVSMPEEKTYIFDTQLPKEAGVSIRDALEFKIEENVPLKFEEASFEYEIIDNKKSSKDITIGVSVIPKKVISDYSDVFDQAGVYPISYEIESKMIANSVIPMGDKGNHIVIDIKDDSTILIAVIDGFVRLTSSVPFGENIIREKLSKTGLSPDELISGNFFETDFPFETTDAKDLYSSLVNIFSVLKDEVDEFDEYIINKFSNEKDSPIDKIDDIILCGRSSTLPGLAKHINQNVRTNIVLANVWTNVLDIKKDAPPNMKFHDSLNFVTPIGLVVSSYKKRNA